MNLIATPNGKDGAGAEKADTDDHYLHNSDGTRRDRPVRRLLYEPIHHTDTERNQKAAAPETSMWTGKPAGFFAASRSRPITPPSSIATATAANVYRSRGTVSVAVVQGVAAASQRPRPNE